MDATLNNRASPKSVFQPTHPADRAVYLAIVALTLFGLVGGFSLDIIDHLNSVSPPYPFVIYIHVVASVAWLALFTAQLLLVRGKRVGMHKRLGIAGFVLVPILVPLNLLASWVFNRGQLAMPTANPQFVCVEIAEVAVFAVLVGSGLWLRKRDTAAHKRLLLLSMAFLSMPGFARLLSLTIGHPFGHGFWPDMLHFYLIPNLMVLSLGVLDWRIRNRLHPAYVVGCGWILFNEVVGLALLKSPVWKDIAIKILNI